jgi:hypothetical protein
MKDKVQVLYFIQVESINIEGTHITSNTRMAKYKQNYKYKHFDQDKPEARSETGNVSISSSTRRKENH